MPDQLPVIAPSILAADYTRLKQQIDACTDGGASWLHCDVMDGHFVPNISFGPMIVEAAARCAPDALIDVHLMIENPGNYIEQFVRAGASLISFHIETEPHAHRVIQAIRATGIQAGIAINPATPLSLLEDVLPEVDLVVVMTVNPGFGGQKFIEPALGKIRRLAEMRDRLDTDFLIQVDGGVGPDNIGRIADAGADILVAGSSVFSAHDITDRVKELARLARTGELKFT
ncbi:MAG: ribulose-phosphate 3-epimerase [Balneolaceae bacterium]|jgi:ribulose-phosphate 3-epimerase|nr:MAG: ribulose-phosphate 3-epimerase [Balneolaceae bacterium]